MVWVELGTVLLNDWDSKFFNTPVIEGGLFRVRQTYNLPPIGKLTFFSTFANNERAVFKSVYPSLEDRLIDMSLPASFIEAGYTVRYFVVKPALRTRWYEASNWVVSLDMWEPDP